MSPDIAASIRARLLSKAKEQGDELELILVRYAIERFLYRLGASHMREQCVLKGATLLTLWLDDPYRASRDVDFHAAGPSSEAAIRAIVTTVCAVPCAEDGIRFDLESLHVSPIREEAESGGQRAILRAYLGKARIRLQIDFGFGDAVTPAPEDSNSPTLLQGLPSSRLRTYPMVVSIAEKFEAMVTLGQRNSRMKDFHDIWALSRAFAIDGPSLRAAIVACFDLRAIAWTPEVPDVLTVSFYQDAELQARWKSYLRSGGLRTPPNDRFEEIGSRVIGFLRPVRDAIVAGAPHAKLWPAGGPWT